MMKSLGNRLWRRSVWACLLAVTLVASGVGVCACGDELVNNRYCSLPAHFVFSPVNSISQLNSACNSLGTWCTVTLSQKKFYFYNPGSGTGEANQTALNGYTGFYMGLCGFIVGTPSIPELGADYSVVTCYDLACPNCYEDFVVCRKLTLLEDGTAVCQSGSNPCHRTYDLNSGGIVSRGAPGKNLFRYRVYYGNNTLSISNR